MIITDRYCKKKRFFCNSSSQKFIQNVISGSLLVAFYHQPQSDAVVFAIITFDLYKKIVTKREHVISTNDEFTFNENLENLSASILL